MNLVHFDEIHELGFDYALYDISILFTQDPFATIASFRKWRHHPEVLSLFRCVWLSVIFSYTLL